jgi:hypothetical protein
MNNTNTKVLNLCDIFLSRPNKVRRSILTTDATRVQTDTDSTLRYRPGSH